MSIVPRKFDGDKCPTCGTRFIDSMHPFDVALRNAERDKRARAAKRGWRKRRKNAGLSHSRNR